MARDRLNDAHVLTAGSNRLYGVCAVHKPDARDARVRTRAELTVLVAAPTVDLTLCACAGEVRLHSKLVDDETLALASEVEALRLRHVRVTRAVNRTEVSAPAGYVAAFVDGAGGYGSRLDRNRTTETDARRCRSARRDLALVAHGLLGAGGRVRGRRIRALFTRRPSAVADADMSPPDWNRHAHLSRPTSLAPTLARQPYTARMPPSRRLPSARSLALLCGVACACVATSLLCCRAPVAPPQPSTAETFRFPEPTLEQRKQHCASMGQEFATGHIYALDLSVAESEPERLAVVPGEIRIAEDLMVFEDDAIVVGGYQGLTWFGSDRVARFLPAPDDRYIYKLESFDMDADGDLDLLAMQDYEVVSEASNTVSSFGKPVVWLREGSALVRSHALQTEGYVNLSDISLLDIGGDAAAELLVLGPRDIETVRTRAGQAPERVALGPLPINLQHLTTGTGDMNGDGLRDLLVLSLHHQASQNNVRVLFAKPGGGYGRAVDSATRIGGRNSGFFDFTGDGIPDLAQTVLDAEARTWSVDLWRGNAEGTFSEPQRISANLGNEPALSAFDYDADGTHELGLWNATLSLLDVRQSPARSLLERELPYPHARRLHRSAKSGHVSAYWVMKGCDGYTMH